MRPVPTVALLLAAGLAIGVSSWWLFTAEIEAGRAADEVAAVAEPAENPALVTEIALRPAHEVAAVGQAEIAPPGLSSRVIRDRHFPQEWLLSGSLLNRYDDLTRRAERGDAEAALELGRTLSLCHQHLIDLKRMEDRLGVSARPFDEAEAAQSLDYLDNHPTSALCAGITEEMAAQHYLWLERAIAAGQVEAATHYYGLRLLDWRQRAELALDPNELIRVRSVVSQGVHRDARRCYQGALFTLAQSYGLGTATPVNRVLATGYSIVNHWAQGMPVSEQRVQAALQRIGPDGLAQAVDFARRFYRSYCQ